MEETRNFKILKEKVLNKSESDTWDEAVKEWKCIKIRILPGSVCACSHKPITNVCVMKNSNTNEELEIGNVCVNNFLGQDFSRKFAELKSKAEQKKFLEENKQVREQVEEFQSMIDSGKLSQWETSFMHEMITMLKKNWQISEGRQKIIDRCKGKVTGEVSEKIKSQIEILKRLETKNDWEKKFVLSIADWIKEREISDKQSQYLNPILKRNGVDWVRFEKGDGSEEGKSKLTKEDFAPLKPYEWQIDAYNSWINSNEKGTIEVGTGLGKTYFELMVILKNPEAKVMIIVPTIHLQHQHRDEIVKELNIPESEIGFIGDGHKETDKRITISIINSVVKMTDVDADIVIFDECHHYVADVWYNFIINNSHRWKKVVGMSATVERDDEQHKIFVKDYPVCYVADQKYGIEHDHICNYEVINIAVNLTPDESIKHKDAVHKINSLKGYYGSGMEWFPNAMNALKQGDATAATLIKANNTRKQVLMHTINKVTRAYNIIQEEKNENGGKFKKTLVFSEFQKSADELFDLLVENGIPCGKYHSGMKLKERKETLQNFRDDKFPILVGVKCLDEGLNVPTVDVAIIIGGTSVKRQMTQRLGRVLRNPNNGQVKLARVYQLYVKGTQDERWLRNRTEPFKGIAKSITWR